MTSCIVLWATALNRCEPNRSSVEAMRSATICASMLGFSTSLISICGLSSLNLRLSVAVNFFMFSPFLPTMSPGRDA